VFGDALWRHAIIVLGALAPTLVLGLPLGFLAHRNLRLRAPLLSMLSLIQTIPSIALFGLLMAPLTALGEALPFLRGVGLTPAILALTLYAPLPIVRNTVSGLDSTPAALLEAARGQGITGAQVFFLVEAPLAAPVLLAGLRITVVQTIGLAAVAALIGAGGLGALMFQGLFANATDLILLGATPIVALAVVVDVLFRLAVETLRTPTIEVEHVRGYNGTTQALSARVVHQLKALVGVGAAVKVLAPDTLPRATHKAKRVEDRRTGVWS
jgi:osmoprotectant transport system permease protein